MSEGLIVHAFCGGICEVNNRLLGPWLLAGPLAATKAHLCRSSLEDAHWHGLSLFFCFCGFAENWPGYSSNMRAHEIRFGL